MAYQLSDAASRAARASLLVVGETYEGEGKLESAARVYLKIIGQYPDSEEAQRAVEKVVGVAEALRTEGHLNRVISLYDRLEEAAQPG
jgi:hypothetical protein